MRIETLADPHGLRAVAALFASVWGSGPGADPLPTDVLVSLAHAGGAVHVARDSEGLAGASAAVFGPPRTHSTYSLIAASARPGSGVGLALKHAQRAWALRHGATSMRWTFDPLVTRNARFNLVKLGAIAREYVADFYGPLADGTNDNDETDRLTVVWALDGVRATDAARGRYRRVEGPDPTEAARAPKNAPDGGPLTVLDAGGLWCRFPTDIVALRRIDPHQATRWRVAVREALAPAFAEDFVAVGMSRDGWCRLTRKEIT
ncbi:MAG: chorismate synthase [Actinophytocola sp.]|nr:chorismate synthase [Actinophytocola sp.]